MVAGERFIAELSGVIVRRQPTLSSDKVSLLEKGDEITAVDVRLPGWKCFRDGLVRPCPYPRRPSLRCFGD
eukprot:symbB.v1.2.016156.t1/scaffold1225.1/size130771/1